MKMSDDRGDWEHEVRRDKALDAREERENPGKVYLGDGAFVAFNGYSFELTTSDGYRDTNRVILDPDVMAALERFVAKVRSL